MNGFVLAGTNSGCGKTTITLGLLSLLMEHGKKVAAFKTGPDFIDPAFHAKVTGSPSYNLDTFLMSNEVVTHLFLKHSANKDIAVVEGVMGLFDGMGEKATGSAAELSKMLGLPVVLVVNCKSMYQSVAAIIGGFKQFDAAVNVAGVILNHVPNADAYVFLKEYIEKRTGVLCLGYLPSNKDIVLESRHLGLVQAEEVEALNSKLQTLTSLMQQTIDIEKLLEISTLANTVVSKPVSLKLWQRDLSKLRIAVARDKAFQFYYSDNLLLLEENGAELVFFSPLADEHLPIGINGIYIGGGYPEVFAKELSANSSMLGDIKRAAEMGISIFAECGGMMYLTEGITDLEGNFNPMVGVFNCQTRMTSRLQRFGYCNVSYENCITRAHEFHRSEIVSDKEPNYSMSYLLNKPEKKKQWICGLKRKNVVAGYAHFHFWSEPTFYNKIIDLWMQTTIQY